MKNFKISKIQQKLKDKNIDSLIINRTDEFLNEYIPQDAERLFWATDFSGSAGRTIISQNNANLFVDGRYTLQSKIETKGIKVKILNINEVINFNYFNDKAEKIKNFGVYTKALSYDYYYKLFSNAKKTKINIVNLNINRLLLMNIII